LEVTGALRGSYFSLKRVDNIINIVYNGIKVTKFSFEKISILTERYNRAIVAHNADKPQEVL